MFAALCILLLLCTLLLLRLMIQYCPLEPRTKDTLFANHGLLELLKEREYIKTKKYDFEALEFLLGSKQAYVC